MTHSVNATSREGKLPGQRIVSKGRLSSLKEVTDYRRLYDNRGVKIPLYENLTEAQLSLRLPISVGIPRQIVDNSADALFGDGQFVGAEMIGSTESDSSRLQALWERVFSANSFRERLLTDAIDAGICGGIFYSVSYDPAHSSVFKVQSISYDQLWDVELGELDESEVKAYIFQWEHIEERPGESETRRWVRVEIDSERITRLRAVKSHTEGDDGDGAEFEVVSVSEHGLGIIPIANVANSVQRINKIGDSDIGPLVPMLNALNQMISDAYWQSYNDQSVLKAINISPPDSEEVEDSVIRLGGDQIHFLNQSDQLKQDIERMKPVGIPESFFRTIELLIAQVYKTAGEPQLDPMKWAGTNVSGVALRLLYEPLAKKTYRKRIYWGAAFERLARIIFAYANSKSVVLSESGEFALGGSGYRLDDVEVHWGPLMPGDEAEEQRIVLDDLSAGLIGEEEARRRRGL
ncbi:MAG: phage portal protein [Candidatus Coatesbacteria bacterium]|nr:phage portal protein [Candidatus Coatesbacteria bacterium]